jgi:hypothetical protein
MCSPYKGLVRTCDAALFGLARFLGLGVKGSQVQILSLRPSEDIIFQSPGRNRGAARHDACPSELAPASLISPHVAGLQKFVKIGDGVG